MSRNPGERGVKPQTKPEQAVEAVRGSITYFRPVLALLVFILAFALVNTEWPLTGLAVAYIAGHVGAR